MKKFLRALFSLAVMLIIPMSSIAQNEQNDELLSLSLEELMNISVVTASKSAEGINDAPGIITVVSNKEIQGFASNNLGEVLNRVVGTAFLTANNWNENVVMIRGQSVTPYNNHVLILLNGRPLRDPISGGLNASVYNSFPIDIIEHIEIIRGPGSVLYGSNAFSGVINIVTKVQDEDGSESFAKIGGGSFGTAYASATTLSKKGEFQSALGVTHFTNTGPEFHITDLGDSTSTQNFDKRTTGVFFNGNYKNLDINAYFGTYDNYSLGGADLNWASNPHDESNHITYQADLNYEIIDKEKYSIHSNLTFNRHELDLDGTNNAVGQDMLFELSSNIVPFKNSKLVVGGTYALEDYFGSRLIANRMNNFSGYLQMDYTVIEMLKFIAGLQYNKIEGIDGNISPRLGFVGNFTKNLGLKILYSEAFRKAYPLETAFNHPVFRGNLELKPELINTFEVQTFFQTEKIQTNLTFYHSVIKDQITRTWFDDSNVVPYGGYLMYGNVDGLGPWGAGTYKFWGLEFESKLSLFKNFFFTLNGLYQEAETNTGIKNGTLHPNWYIKGGLMYDGNKFKVGIFNSHFGEPYQVNLVNPDVNMYNKVPTSFDLLSLKFTTDLFELITSDTDQELLISISANNLLDKDIRYPEYTSKEINSLTPLYGGRAFYFDIAFKF